MIIDVNVNYGIWPFRRFQLNSLEKIERQLRENRVDCAFISHLGGALNFQEVDEYNNELYRKVKNKENFCFVPIVNPKLADAEERIEKFKAIKVVPTYHSYSITDKRFHPFFRKISDREIALFIQMRYEDERSHNPLFKINPPPIEEIKAFAKSFPEIKIILLCGYFNEVVELCKVENIYSDISFVESYKTMKSLLSKTASDKILFGSHTPFLYLGAEIAKLEYAEAELEEISYKNALLLFEDFKRRDT